MNLAKTLLRTTMSAAFITTAIIGWKNNPCDNDCADTGCTVFLSSWYFMLVSLGISSTLMIPNLCCDKKRGLDTIQDYEAYRRGEHLRAQINIDNPFSEEETSTLLNNNDEDNSQTIERPPTLFQPSSRANVRRVTIEMNPSDQFIDLNL